VKLTRRRLVVSAGAAAAASLLPARRLAAAHPEASPLPAALKPDVFRERQAKLRSEARARGFDALLVTPSSNLAYSANLAIARSERLTALVLFADGPAVLVTPSFEEANHKRAAVVDDVMTWQEEQDPIALVAKRLGGAKRIGIEGSTAYATAATLAAATSERLEDATPLFDALRMIKSAEEQTFIKEAARRTNLAIQATQRRLRGGITESEVSRMLEEEFDKLGVSGGGLVQFGPSSAFPHGAPADRRLARGDAVLMDCGCKVRGYSSDITRTVSFGPPSDELRKVYAIVDRAQIAGIDRLKAGATGEEVDQAARKVIEDGGYGQYFTHRLGHGLGLDGHEPPYLVAGNKKPLVVGNTVTIEPGIYIPNRFGVRIEDDYGVRQETPASLSTRPGDMMVLPV
jgi:Xaa-Pro dipeptidase